MYIYKIHNIGRNTYKGTSMYFSNLNDAIEFANKMYSRDSGQWGKLSYEWNEDKTKLRMYTEKRFCLESIIKIQVNE